MRKIALIFVPLLLLLSSCATMDYGRATTAGIKALQAASVTDEQIKGYVSEFVVASDKENKVASSNDPYNLRLNRIAGNFNGKEGINIKVYITDDVNAFAVADGNIRVYSGLMDIMSDEEVLGVIGHEIGHVMLKHSKEAFKRALLTSALRDGIASTGGTAALLSDSQLGALGEALVSSQYSQKQEREADDYGYAFLVKHGYNPWAMAMSFEKLWEMQGSSEYQSGAIQQLFSTHPDIRERIGRMQKRAEADGYKRPTGTKSTAKPNQQQGKTTKTEAPKTSSKWSF